MSSTFRKLQCQQIIGFDPQQIFRTIIMSSASDSLKSSMLEAFRDEIRRYTALCLHLNPEPLIDHNCSKMSGILTTNPSINMPSVFLSENSMLGEEEALWDELDRLQQNIIEAKRTACELKLAVECYIQEEDDQEDLKQMKQSMLEEITCKIIVRKREIEDKIQQEYVMRAGQNGRASRTSRDYVVSELPTYTARR